MKLVDQIFIINNSSRLLSLRKDYSWILNVESNKKITFETEMYNSPMENIIYENKKYIENKYYIDNIKMIEKEYICKSFTS